MHCRVYFDSDLLKKQAKDNAQPLQPITQEEVIISESKLQTIMQSLKSSDNIVSIIPDDPMYN
jgi:hypothetical protein